MAARTAPPEEATTDRPFDRATTSEAEWRRRMDALPAMAVLPDRVLVVAPHPDDETLGVGAALAAWTAAGVEVRVLTVTDGEGSHPGRPGLVELRAAEQRAALEALGLPEPAHRLGLPDAAVAAHEDRLVEAIAARSRPGTLVLAPWARDGHTDHEAAGRAARAAAAASGAAIATFPVWAWRWARPQQLDRIGLIRLEATAAARAAKERALACYRSQFDGLVGPPILPPDALAHFRRPYEVITVPTHA